jgi:hypothetical protein
VNAFGMHHQCSILQQAEYKKNIKTMNFKGYNESIAHIPTELFCEHNAKGYKLWGQTAKCKEY